MERSDYKLRVLILNDAVIDINYYKPNGIASLLINSK